MSFPILGTLSCVVSNRFQVSNQGALQWAYPAHGKFTWCFGLLNSDGIFSNSCSSHFYCQTERRFTWELVVALLNKAKDTQVVQVPALSGSRLEAPVLQGAGKFRLQPLDVHSTGLTAKLCAQRSAALASSCSADPQYKGLLVRISTCGWRKNNLDCKIM